MNKNRSAGNSEFARPCDCRRGGFFMRQALATKRTEVYVGAGNLAVDIGGDEFEAVFVGVFDPGDGDVGGALFGAGVRPGFRHGLIHLSTSARIQGRAKLRTQ